MRTVFYCLLLAIPLVSVLPDLAVAESPAARQRIEQEDMRMARARALGVWRGIGNHRLHLHQFPLPRTTTPPKVDGKLDDPCWAAATSVFDSARCFGFDPDEPTMRYRLCADDGCLYVGLDMRLRRSREATSTIEVRAKNKVAFIEFNQSKVRYRGPDSKDFSNWVDWGKFVGDRTGGSCEIAIPMRQLFGDDWKRDGVRLCFRYGPYAGSDLTEHRWMQLYSSPAAFVLDESKDGRIGATLIGSPDKDTKLQVEASFVRDSAPEREERLASSPVDLKKGERKRVDIDYRIPFHEGAGAVKLTIKGDGWDCRHACYTVTLPISPLAQKIQDLLQTCAGDKLKPWQEAAADIFASVEKLKVQFAKASPDPKAWRALYLRARGLQREIFLSRLPADLDRILFVKRYPYTAGGRWFTTHYHVEPGGHNLCVYSIRTGALRPILNVPDHTALRDPDLSYDGRKIVFTARSGKPEIFSGFSDDLHDVWSIYEVNADGTALKRLTKSEAYDLEPVYLPNGRVLFGSLRSSCWGCCTGHSAYNFHVMDSDGSNIQRFTYNYLYDVAASVMPDGRIVFLRWVHEDKPGNHINALWTVRQDGSGLAGFFGMNVYGCFIEPRGIPGTNQVVCIDSGESGHWRLPQNGHIGIIDPDLDRNLLAHRIDTPLPFGEGWGFKTPYPLTRDLFLASFGNLWAGFGIYAVDRQGNMELLYKEPDLSCFNAVPFAPRTSPPVTSPATADRGDDEPAVVSILNVYAALPGVKPGTVKGLRVIHVPDKDIVNNGNSHFADQTIAVSYVYRMVRKVLGTAPVHEDGSACFTMPAGKAVYFQLLDEDGLMVQTMRDTMSFKPGERASCIGCHEPRETTPPASMSVPLALHQPPATLQPLKGGVHGVSFPRDIQPILDRACVKCHDITKPEGGVILSGDVTETFNIAYEELNKHNRDWGHSRHPRQTEAITPVITYIAESIPPLSSGAHASLLFKKYVFTKHYDVKLTKQEIATLAMWVDLNLPYYDDWDSKRYDGGRNIRLSAETRKVLQDVCRRRCASCHADKKPLMLDVGLMVNLNRPELSKILYAPLSAGKNGGKGEGKMAVFKDTHDPDYQAILNALRKEQARIPDLVKTVEKGKAG